MDWPDYIKNEHANILKNAQIKQKQINRAAINFNNDTDPNQELPMSRL